MGESLTSSLFDAFKPELLIVPFVKFAPFLLGVVSTLIAIQLIKWGINFTRTHLSFDPSGYDAVKGRMSKQDYLQQQYSIEMDGAKSQSDYDRINRKYNDQGIYL